MWKINRTKSSHTPKQCN